MNISIFLTIALGAIALSGWIKVLIKSVRTGDKGRIKVAVFILSIIFAIFALLAALGASLLVALLLIVSATVLENRIKTLKQGVKTGDKRRIKTEIILLTLTVAALALLTVLVISVEF